MDFPVAAVAVIGAGVLAAAVGIVLTTLAARRAAPEAEAGRRSELAFGLTIAGIVAVMIGGAFLGYLVLIEG